MFNLSHVPTRIRILITFAAIIFIVITLLNLTNLESIMQARDLSAYEPLLPRNEYVLGYTNYGSRSTPNFALSPEQNTLVYLSADSGSLKFIDLEGNLQLEVGLGYSDKDLSRLRDIIWFSDNKISFILGKQIVLYDISTRTKTTLFTASQNIQDSCWTNNGQSLVVAARHNEASVQLFYFDLQSFTLNELDFESIRFASVQCNRQGFSIFIHDQTSEIVSIVGDSVSRQEVSTLDRHRITSFNEIPGTVLSITSQGTKSSHCIHLNNYLDNQTFTIARHRQIIEGLTYSSRHSALVIDVKSASGNKLYKRTVSLSPGQSPSNIELTTCPHT